MIIIIFIYTPTHTHTLSLTLSSHIGTSLTPQLSGSRVVPTLFYPLCLEALSLLHMRTQRGVVYVNSGGDVVREGEGDDDGGDGVAIVKRQGTYR